MLNTLSATILQELRDSGLPACLVDGVTPDISAAELRTELAKWTDRADTDTDADEKHTVDITDVAIPGEAGSIAARIYRPHTVGRKGSILYFHGGGWVLGGLDDHDILCERLADASARTVVAIDYRLAPEHPFPAAVEDALAATEWWFAHAAEFGEDPERIAISGDSAGGNLAAVVCLARRDLGQPLPRAQVLIYPVTDDDTDNASYRRYAVGYHLGQGVMRWFINSYLPNPADRRNPLAFPMRSDNLRGLPPALVIVAECDPLAEEAERYADRLSSFGVAARCSIYTGMIHSFYAASPEALTETTKFLDEWVTVPPPITPDPCGS